MSGSRLRPIGWAVIALASLELYGPATAQNALPMHRPDVEVLTDTTVARQTTRPGVDSAVAAAAGGLFAVGLSDEHVPEYLKFSADGTLEWRTLQTAPAAHEVPHIAMNARDGGYWVLGTAQSAETDPRPGPGWVERLAAVQYDYLRHVDASGQPGPATTLARTAESHFVYCAIEVSDGYVLAGADAGGPPLASTVPWIEKLDRTGRQVWVRLFAEDHGQQMLGPDFTDFNACSGLLSGSDGSITWATPIHTFESHPGSPDWEQVANDRQRNHFATFVVQLAADGTELARTRHYEVRSAVLTAAGSGFLLLERIEPMLHPAPRGATPAQVMQALRETRRMQREDLGIRLTAFDARLRELKTNDVHIPDYYEDLRVVYRTADGGLLLDGCEQGTNHLAFIDKQGRISPRRTWSPPMPPQCSRATFAPTGAPDEIELLSYDELRGLRVLRLRYLQ